MGTGKAKFEYKEGENMEKGSMKKTVKKMETKEASRTLGNGSRNYPLRKGLPKMKVKPNSALSEEVVQLRDKNEEYKKGNLSTDFLKRFGIIDKLTEDIKADQRQNQVAAIAGAIMHSEFFRSKVKSSNIPSHRWKSHMDRR